MATGSAHYALSRTGTLVSLPGSVDVDNRMLVRVDLQGRVEPLTRETRPFITVRTSPDGRRLALWIGTADDEVWTYEIERGFLTRLAPGAAHPVWSPDGEWIVFSHTRAHDTARVRADGSGGPETLLTTKSGRRPSSISPDGKLVAFTGGTPETGSDVWTLSLDTRDTRLVLGGRSNESAAVFSPDGRLLAFASDETGHDEVYVQPFPGPGAKRQVSVGGGTGPVWGRQAGEIFYQNGTDIMSVSVRAMAAEIRASLSRRPLPEPPRPQAREREGDPGRRGQGPRLRPGQGTHGRCGLRLVGGPVAGQPVDHLHRDRDGRRHLGRDDQEGVTMSLAAVTPALRLRIPRDQSGRRPSE